MRGIPCVVDGAGDDVLRLVSFAAQSWYSVTIPWAQMAPKPFFLGRPLLARRAPGRGVRDPKRVFFPDGPPLEAFAGFG